MKSSITTEECDTVEAPLFREALKAEIIREEVESIEEEAGRLTSEMRLLWREAVLCLQPEDRE